LSDWGQEAAKTPQVKGHARASPPPPPGFLPRAASPDNRLNRNGSGPVKPV